ncbi:GNAT family N-acetyltransferase [Poseidonibacter sp.]|uniref:GNAT family N-acetyltransferase n=1 Tax=Poseidonibacter sp. TaxID=2321188 RepID=UPI003C71A9AF
MNSRRMRMRATTVEDAPLLITWYKQKELLKHVGFDEGLCLTLEKQTHIIMNQKGDEKLMMLTLLDDTPIGECHFKNIRGASCEIGLKIGDLNYQGQGYGKEGLHMLLAHLFGVLGMKIVFLDVLESNERARHLYKKVGFKETSIRQNAWTDSKGEARAIVYMTLTLDDFKMALNVPFPIV